MPPPGAEAAPVDLDAEAAEILRRDLTAYEVLDISPRAGPSIIKKAYIELVQRWHPDKCAHPRATEVMQRLNAAWETLRDPARRFEYDASLGRAGGRAAPRMSAWIGATLRNGAYGRLMDLVARIDEKGMHGLTLPKIVVVGLESHGKSSLMERLALREVFPRGDGFVTRMPILLKLRRVNYENSVTIRLMHVRGNSRGVQEENTYYDTGRQNFADIVATKIQEFISRKHGQGDGMHILVDQEIEIEVRAGLSNTFPRPAFSGPRGRRGRHRPLGPSGHRGHAAGRAGPARHRLRAE